METETMKVRRTLVGQYVIDDGQNDVCSQINELMSLAEDASVRGEGEPDGWDAYDAVRVAIMAQLASSGGWGAAGYEYKIRAGPGGAQRASVRAAEV